jgi:hypothetical protein
MRTRKKIRVALLQPRRVADWVFCSGQLRFWLRDVLQCRNITATRLAELFVMRELLFRAIALV